MPIKNLDASKEMLKSLNLYYTASVLDSIIEKTIEKSMTCEKFLDLLLKREIQARESNKLEKRLKQGKKYKKDANYCMI